jgi:hypothetical protein
MMASSPAPQRVAWSTRRNRGSAETVMRRAAVVQEPIQYECKVLKAKPWNLKMSLQTLDETPVNKHIEI